MPGFELRLQPLMLFETKPEAGGGSTIILGGDLDNEARVYVASNQYVRAGRKGMDHAGTLVVARYEEDTEIIHASIPERENRDRLARDRAMTLLTFAMLTEDPHYGNWQGDEQVFVDPTNQDGVDPDYLASAGIRVRRRAQHLENGEVQYRAVNMARATGRVAAKTLGEIRRVQAYKAHLPDDYEGASVWLDAEKDVA